jgi:hypothetical protein
MKKVLLSFLLTLLPMLVSAEAVEIDGIWYNLVSKVKEAKVTSNPKRYKGNVEIPPSVIYEGETYKVTSIGDYAFSFCTGLTSITIPNSVTSIGEGAFSGCSGLTSISIPNTVTSISGSAFSGCSGLTSVTIPNSVTSISGSAFSGCTGLTSITIPNSVTSIVHYAFSGCTGLTSVTIPNSVTNIDYYAFQNCNNISSVTIGEKVNKISMGAFTNCQQLTDVICLAENVPNTASDAFNNSYIEYATLHVPAASLSSYSNSEPWKNFKNIVAIGSGEIPEVQKCATPTISFNNGKVSFTCETEGAEFVSEVKAGDAKLYYDSEFTLSQKYTISVYATKTGYDNSDTVTRDIIITGDGKAIIVGDVDGDGKVNVADHVELSRIILNQ